jgi:outer membrane protein TolC
MESRSLSLHLFFGLIVSNCIFIPCQAQSSNAAAPQIQNRTMMFTVPEAVSFALDHYPSVRAALENYYAVQAAVDVAKTSYLPAVNAAWQGDRGTRNSVYGVLLPQFPTIMTGTQGSVRADSNQSYWMSGMGVLAYWEPYTFGFRESLMRAARADASRASAQVELTRLDVASAVANGALSVLASEQRVAASQADVDRRGVFGRSVHVLVDNHIRPGVDASRADAELAMARTQLILAQQTLEVSRAALAQILGIAGSPVEIDGVGLIQNLPPQADWAQPPLQSHPAAVAEQRTVEQVESGIDVLNHSFYPHVSVEELTSGRGAGEIAGAKATPGWGGLGVQAGNWEAGINVQVNLSDYFLTHRRKKVEAYRLQREQAVYAQTLDTITGQVAQSRAALDGARRAAENTPVELKASEDSELQARARFQAGLATLVDVAEAQRLLVQAEIDDKLTRLSIWRSLAALASAQGNLDPFLNLAAGAK